MSHYLCEQKQVCKTWGAIKGKKGEEGGSTAVGLKRVFQSNPLPLSAVPLGKATAQLTGHREMFKLNDHHGVDMQGYRLASDLLAKGDQKRK